MASYTVLAAAFLMAGGLLGFLLSKRGALLSFFSDPIYQENLSDPLRTVLLIAIGYLGMGSIEVMMKRQLLGARLSESPGGFPIEMMHYDPLLVFAIVGVVAPVLEEILARGYFLEPFMRFGKPVVGVLLSSILFGFAHWPHSLAATAFGLSMCFLRFASGSLAVPIAAHIGINSFLLVMTYLSPRASGATPLPTNEFEFALVFSVNLAMVIASLPVFFRIYRMFVPIHRDSPIY